jgi:uncharacterized protein (TIGR00297 family)
MTSLADMGTLSEIHDLLVFALPLLIVIIARLTRALSWSGAVAAMFVGTIALAAGYGWGVLLLAFFVSATALSHAGRADKERRTAAVLAKGGERDAAQVLANGALFAIAAAAWRTTGNDVWMAAGGGAIAAACADTWSTEIGTLARGAPRSIATGRAVPTGTSGGVTPLGLAAMVVGALFLGGAGWLAGWPLTMRIAYVAGGIVGAMADSFIGAVWQSRRRCDRCAALTERLVHDCGARTVAAGGFSWLNNDVVNALCTAIGALAAVACWRALA